jgi:hypothetical protein
VIVFFFLLFIFAVTTDMGFNSCMTKSRLLHGVRGRLPAKLPLTFIIYAAVIIFVGSAWAWWYHVQTNQDRLFWGMIQNSLRTPGFSRTIVQEDGQQKLEQVVEVRTAPLHLANSRSIITQGEPATTRVITESIGTPTTDYVRYSDIQTSQKGQTGNDLDFSNVKNVWGKAEAEGGTTNGQLYNESVLGLIPFGNLTGAQQEALIKEMKDKNVYSAELASVQRSGLLRRPTYSFNVQVNPAAYISALKSFAKSTGLTHLETVDPSQYQSTQPVTVVVSVDGWSRQLKEVSYGGGTRVEKFTGLNSIKPLQTPPQDTVPISELQARLQTVQ